MSAYRIMMMPGALERLNLFLTCTINVSGCVGPASPAGCRGGEGEVGKRAQQAHHVLCACVHSYVT